MKYALVCLLLMFGVGCGLSDPPPSNPKALSLTSYRGKTAFPDGEVMGTVLDTPPMEPFNSSLVLVPVHDGATPGSEYVAFLMAKSDHIKPGEIVRCRFDHTRRGNLTGPIIAWLPIGGCEPMR